MRWSSSLLHQRPSIQASGSAEAGGAGAATAAVAGGAVLAGAAAIGVAVEGAGFVHPGSMTAQAKAVARRALAVFIDSSLDEEAIVRQKALACKASATIGANKNADVVASASSAARDFSPGSVYFCHRRIIAGACSSPEQRRA